MRIVRYTFCAIAAFGIAKAGWAEGNHSKKKAKTAAASESDQTPAAKPRRQSVHDQVTGQGYGLAGCGLGSVAFGPKPGGVQIIATTLNGTSGSQTFGISSATSNCDIPEMGANAAVFIEINKQALKSDVSRGHGETIDSLAQIFKCRNTETFGEILKNQYSTIFKNEGDSYDNSRQILKTIQSDERLKTSCDQLG